MGKQAPITLDAHFEQFILDQTSRGRYESASDVVQAGLRLLQEREAKLLALQTAITEGEASGEPVPFDFDELYKEIEGIRSGR